MNLASCLLAVLLCFNPTITAQIHREAAGDTALEHRLMAIYAGESDHHEWYDIGDILKGIGTSFGPFQLHYPGLADRFQKETGLDPKNEKTIPQQVHWVAEYLRHHKGQKPWHGYRHGEQRLKRGQAPIGGQTQLREPR
jgi:hypothetical protein